jgi:hypothetical protein
LFRDYLAGRFQYVSCNNVMSDRLLVTKGVPQGSCLGPLLFLIYVNDVQNQLIQGKLYLFADDTALFYSNSTLSINCMKAQSDLQLIDEYFANNGLSLNSTKTKVMHFHTAQRGLPNFYPRISLKSEMVEQVESFKYLGLFLDSNLTWNVQVNFLMSKLKSIAAILYRARNLLPEDVRLMLYWSMFHSQLSYMIELWGAASMTLLRQLQILQNRCLKSVFGVSFYTSRYELYQFVATKILPIKGIYEFAMAKFVYKNVNGISKGNLHFCPSVNVYSSRSGALIMKPRCRLELGKKRMSYAGPCIYDRLPLAIKHSLTLSRFCRRSLGFFKSDEQMEFYLNY